MLSLFLVILSGLCKWERIYADCLVVCIVAGDPSIREMVVFISHLHVLHSMHVPRYRMSLSFFMFHCFWLIVVFILEESLTIVGHHCLNFLFIIIIVLSKRHVLSSLQS